MALPLVITLAVTAFAWPAARLAPRDLPVGIVGTGTASQHAVEGLTHKQPGAFDLHIYPDQQAARSAIENRDVYGAFVISSHNITVLQASAASPSVAQLLGQAGQQLADRATQQAATGTHSSTKAQKTQKAQKIQTVQTVGMKAVDVVPVAAEDPRGVVFSSAVFPLTICGILIGAFVAMARGLRRPWHQVLTLLIACGAAGFGVHVVAQGFLGALPHGHVATWAVLSLVLISISATAAGLIRLVGPAGLGLTAALMVFVGNPFSGATSAPEMLPKGVDQVGQWLPPGAGAGLLRDTTYFDGNGGAGHLAALALWSVCGLTAVMCGHWVTGEGRGSKTGATASGELVLALPGPGSASATGRHAHAHAHARRHDGDG
ncbi:ABC transporter permease [Streptomyces sp. NPDC101151]|uniref:ABC transporter permease n=1 Tax=Streptomyces sp. NPDC101151 TaxID=3366115 RepID=UPI0037F247BE